VHIAEVNVHARPGGEAQTKLAQAYARVGRLADARRVIDATLATAWDTAELHATASIVLAAQGETERAGTERARALAIDPHSIDTLQWLSTAPNGAAR
jgi:Tfp pilus assembly protein PilF